MFREITELIEENRADIRTAIGALPTAISNFSGMAGEIQEVVAENRAGIGTTVTAIGDAGRSIATIVEENRVAVRGALADLGVILADGRVALAKLWPRVQATADVLPATVTLSRKPRHRLAILLKKIAPIFALPWHRWPRLVRGLPRLLTIWQ